MISNINEHERKVYSQQGEDGILEAIFAQIGSTNNYFVEFGVGPPYKGGKKLDVKIHGLECTTRYLQEKGWNGLLMNGKGFPEHNVKEEFITAENINDLFAKYDVPKEFDLLSIDIDFNDLYVWDAITGYSPRVVVVEYNSAIPPTESKVVKYNAKRMWDYTNYFGASFLAFIKLGQKKGYTCIGCDKLGVNMFFVKDELIDGNFDLKDIQDLYKPPGYGKRVEGRRIGHRPNTKEFMIDYV
jgi:hypothetical protein